MRYPLFWNNHKIIIYTHMCMSCKTSQTCLMPKSLENQKLSYRSIEKKKKQTWKLKIVMNKHWAFHSKEFKTDSGGDIDWDKWEMLSKYFSEWQTVLYKRKNSRRPPDKILKVSPVRPVNESIIPHDFLMQMLRWNIYQVYL